MKLHRRWASRRAWRARALLAALLALAAWPLRVWLGYWALALPLLALLYPSHRQEARALAEIDRSLGLAYRTALETPLTDPAYRRLQREAAKVQERAVLPRFPWLELALAAAVWLAAGLSPPPRPPAVTARQAAEPPVQTTQRSEGRQTQDETGPASSGQPAQAVGGREETKPGTGAEGERTGANESGQAEGGQMASGETAGESASPEKGAAGEAATPAGGKYDREQPARSGAREPQPGGQEAGGEEVGGGQAQEKGEEGGQATAASGESGGVAGAGGGEEAAGGGGAGRPDGLTGDAPEAMPVPPPRAPAGLPSPWQGGPPPEDVQRAAERYIEDNPLPPGAAEALKRYFELGD